MTRYRALLIDLDDTLFDRTAALRAWSEVAARSQLGRSLVAAEWHLLRELDARGHRSREIFAGDVLAQLGLTIDPQRFAAALAEHVIPEPGVAACVARLAANRRVAIVTNGGAAQRVKLRAIGLESIVHAVFVSGELGIAKPAPGIFERALCWTEHPAAEVLFVGDDPNIDLAPAAALGMATAWRGRDVPWPVDLARPTFQIARIEELEAL
jgi:FMN phosphatase YigB (HAD superfamily)